MENLDKICAEYGYHIAERMGKAAGDYKKAENMITKALHVLREQGLYAFGLFCKAEDLKVLEDIVKELLKDKQLIDNGDLLEEIRKDGGLASRIDYLLLSVHMLEKTLIYARYHAKAQKESERGGGNQV